MKICFSTLGCPEWAWDDIVAIAKDLGYDGIEVRGIENELYVPAAKPFIGSNIENTKKNLLNMGLGLSCLTSACYLHMQGDNGKKDYIAEGKEYIDLAQKLAVPYVRVLGDTDPKAGENIDIAKVTQSLKELGEYAENKGVMVLIETNGVFADSELLKSVIIDVGSNGVGVLWDIHHPFRYMNEPLMETYNLLKPYIMHVHVKDSIMQDKKVKYKMVGEGDVPVKECLQILKDNGFEGFVSLEWVKRWYSDLEEPGIVFMQFINYIKDTLNKI